MEIQDPASIELLSVRQLKELLANNFVDYKGCCEKRELVMRVRQLWTDHQRNINYGLCCFFLLLQSFVFVTCKDWIGFLTAFSAAHLLT